MTHVWFWKSKLRERKGQPCRVLARGKKNSILVEFKDGYKVITSRFAVRKHKRGTMKTYKFKKGEVYTLDCVYDIFGLIPTDAYDQDDIANSRRSHGKTNDSGETLKFKKNVTIKIDVKVKA